MAESVLPISSLDTAGEVVARRPERLESVDLLRGIVMLVMGLDHTREFFTAFRFQPENLARSFPALFFTRWITHFCAPAFFFLAGTGAFLWMARGRSLGSLSRFLWTRGVWLIVLELTIVDFAFTFSTRYQLAVVFWTLGWSMIALAALVRAPRWVIVAISLAMVLLHNCFDGVRASGWTVNSVVLSLLHFPSLHVTASGRVIGIFYPLVPWIGVMALGYVFGHLYRMEQRRRRGLMLAIGAAITLAFVILRLTNWYGDPGPWTHQRSVVMTICSFLNCTKYPPSLCFLLMTLGPAILFLAAVDGKHLRIARPVLIYGRVPLFFFIVHLYAIHLTAIILALVYHQPTRWLFHGAVIAGAPAGYGHGLVFVYAIWGAIMVAVYPACRWYANLKRRSNNVLFSYL
jgi:uncharacterized membrane protein